MKTEKVLTTLFALAVLAYFYNVPGNSILLTLVLITLTFIYFPLSFYFYADKSIKQQNMVLSVLGGMVLSMIPLGILFKLLFWPGYTLQLIPTLFLTPILLVAVVFLSQRSSIELKTYYRNYLTRIVFWLLMSLVFFLIPAVTLIKVKYRHEPDLARIKIQVLENPNNTDYYQQLENYYRQRDSLAFEEEKRK